MKKYKHLTYKNRVEIEILFKQKKSITQIAGIIGVNYSTIWRELKRGLYYHRSSFNYKEYPSYSCDLAYNRYQANLKAKGVAVKLGNDYEYANYLADKIKENKSPEAILGEIKRKKLKFKTSICVTTFYNYIDKDVFYNLSNNDLTVKANKKRKYIKVIDRTNKRLNGLSIDQRPKEIDTRSEIGNWEIDTVIGKKTDPKCFLVFTERKTRYEMIFLLDKHTSECVNNVINNLKIKYQDNFYKIFKTITCDNGTEFSSLYKVHNKVYYCHPYSSWERGSNEVANKMIRRFYPKGRIIRASPDEIKHLEDYINNYPRPMFNFKTSKMLFEEELSKI